METTSQNPYPVTLAPAPATCIRNQTEQTSRKGKLSALKQNPHPHITE
jgi:hypothetical protein